ncbi:MAG: hypothetical protein ACOX27_09830 [Caldicoprobacterales bacterium]|jgi:hypothetical protein|nr:hypothetical protein [Clostridiales bacterium]
MIHYRRMKLGDLDPIYRDPEMRPLITTSSGANKFAVVIEEDDRIIGGAAGFVAEGAAYMENVIVKQEVAQRILYMDGLIRSVIHFLELDGVKYLFAEGDYKLYSSIGFNKLHSDGSFIKEHNEAIEILYNKEYTYWLRLEDFFKQKEN